MLKKHHFSSFLVNFWGWTPRVLGVKTRRGQGAGQDLDTPGNTRAIA
jgi:hypothetical protein